MIHIRLYSKFLASQFYSKPPFSLWYIRSPAHTYSFYNQILVNSTHSSHLYWLYWTWGNQFLLRAVTGFNRTYYKALLGLPSPFDDFAAVGLLQRLKACFPTDAQDHWIGLVSNLVEHNNFVGPSAYLPHTPPLNAYGSESFLWQWAPSEKGHGRPVLPTPLLHPRRTFLASTFNDLCSTPPPPTTEGAFPPWCMRIVESSCQQQHWWDLKKWCAKTLQDQAHTSSLNAHTGPVCPGSRVDSLLWTPPHHAQHVWQWHNLHGPPHPASLWLIWFSRNRTSTPGVLLPPPPHGPCHHRPPHLLGPTAHSPSIDPTCPSSHTHLWTVHPPPTWMPVLPTMPSSSARQTSSPRTTSSKNVNVNVHWSSSCRKWHTGKHPTLPHPLHTSTVTRWTVFLQLYPHLKSHFSHCLHHHHPRQCRSHILCHLTLWDLALCQCEFHVCLRLWAPSHQTRPNPRTFLHLLFPSLS